MNVSCIDETTFLHVPNSVVVEEARERSTVCSGVSFTQFRIYFKRCL